MDIPYISVHFELTFSVLLIALLWIFEKTSTLRSVDICSLPEEEEPRFVGLWGQRHLQYLKEYRRNVYLDLMMSGRLNSYLADIEEQAQERFERIVEQVKQAQGITEQLKADNA